MGYYQQDWYASNWFKTTQVLMTMWIMANILSVIIQGSSVGWYALAPELVVFIIVIMLWVLAGIAWSRVFKWPSTI